MDKSIQKILIVGGGTAGWLSACYLNRAFGDRVKITLLESPDIPRIGVGEATVQTLRATLGFIGLRDEDWMPKVGGTYKSAIKFVDWVDEAPDRRRSFYHPFIRHPGPSITPFGAPHFPEIGMEVALTHYAHLARLNGETRTIAEMLLPTPALCDAKKSPVNPEDHSLDVATAFHLDAARLAEVLAELGKSRGVEHVVDLVADVELDERGFISSVSTKDGLSLEADFYIDCTGFSGRLINQVLGVKFRSDNHLLLCDSAVAISAAAEPKVDGINPYTTATALSHGWAWDIPLRHRRGCGYVYSSAFTSKDNAESELRKFLGKDVEGAEARHIKIRVGANLEPWYKNCVAIGLSGAFLEPLESTGIFLIEYALALLLTLFPDKDIDQGRARRFNDGFQQMYEETRDFIILHYYLNRRNDTEFWSAARADGVLTDSLRAKLEFLETGLPVLDKLRLSNFRSFAFTCILDGCDHLPKKPAPIVNLAGQRAAEEAFAKLAAVTERTVAAMPSHLEALEKMGI